MLSANSETIYIVNAWAGEHPGFGMECGRGIRGVQRQPSLGKAICSRYRIKLDLLQSYPACKTWRGSRYLSDAEFEGNQGQNAPQSKILEEFIQVRIGKVRFLLLPVTRFANQGPPL